MGLRYAFAGLYRSVRVKNGTLLPPKRGWGNHSYVLIRIQDGTKESVLKDELSKPGHSFWTPIESSNKLEVMKEESTTDQTPKTEVKKAITEPTTINGSLKKGQLRQLLSKSSIARTALAQCNQMNRALRHQVYSTKWHGSGGFLKCDGTTKEQAQENASLREKIVRHEEVKAFYRRFTLEDSNVVVLNSSLALDHVRQCVNDLKRQRATSGLVIETYKDTALDDTGSDKFEPRQISTKNKSLPENVTHFENSRCELELKRARNVKRNFDELYKLKLGKKVDLLEDDAYVVGLSFCPPSLVASLTAKKSAHAG